MQLSWSLTRYLPWPRESKIIDAIRELSQCSRELRFVYHTLDEMRGKGRKSGSLLDGNASARHSKLRTHLFHTRHGPVVMKSCLLELMKARRGGAKLLARRSLAQFKCECASYADFIVVILRDFGPDGREADVSSARLLDVGKMLLSVQRSAELLSNIKTPTKVALNDIIRLVDLLERVLEQYAGVVNLLEYGDYKV